MARMIPGAIRRLIGRGITGLAITRLLLIAVAVSACSLDKLVGTAQPPDNILNPASAKTPAGALAAYRGALVDLGLAYGGYNGPTVRFSGAGGPYGSFIASTALLSDELQASDIGAPIGTSSNVELVDARFLPEYVDPSSEPQILSRGTYSALQMVRGQSRQAIGLLAAYAPNTSPALAGHLNATLGYSEVMLAELFCSGIPLSTVDYDGDYTLQPGSTTDAVLQHAVALFDTALTQATDSARVMNLARVGKARALLDLGRYAEAAQAVAEVPDDFRYLESFASEGYSESFANVEVVIPGFPWFGTVADREGGTGLDFISSGDPRSAATATGGTNQYGVTLLYPTKYTQDGNAPLVLADGLEARLIQAEAALQAHDASWLTTLNAIRTTCADVMSCPDPALAGSGGVTGLPPLVDPVDPDARVDLLFRERAFWLFLTGHRQGDLRRLIRQYGRHPNAVYPTGLYPGGTGVYGTDVTAPIPATERAFNPRFTGCINRGA